MAKEKWYVAVKQPPKDQHDMTYWFSYSSETPVPVFPNHDAIIEYAEETLEEYVGTLEIERVADDARISEAKEGQKYFNGELKPGEILKFIDNFQKNPIQNKCRPMYFPISNGPDSARGKEYWRKSEISELSKKIPDLVSCDPEEYYIHRVSAAIFDNPEAARQFIKDTVKDGYLQYRGVLKVILPKGVNVNPRTTPSSICQNVPGDHIVAYIGYTSKKVSPNPDFLLYEKQEDVSLADEKQPDPSDRAISSSSNGNGILF